MRFTRQGQSCSASSRIFVHRSLVDAFVDKLKVKVDALKIGDPLDEQTDVGTVISQTQFDKVRQYIRLGQELEGVQSITCAQMPTAEALAGGFYLRPVLFVGVANDSRIAREEIFGPVACIIPFDDYEDTLRQANDSEYGLMASIWTRDLHTALDAAERLEAGYVQVNQSAVAGMGLPYGGFKNSGLGKEFSLRAMLDHFTREKTIVINTGK
jgi:acyl-CoA reductase-like NAD-dependent aldehyde dehydrogenase